MPYSLTPTNQHLVLSLHGAANIYDAQELAAQLRENIEPGRPILVEMQQLEEIDTCMLQLLYSLRSSGAAVTLGNPAEPFWSAAEAVGLHREFDRGSEEL